MPYEMKMVAEEDLSLTEGRLRWFMLRTGCGGAFPCQGHKPRWKPGPFSPVALRPKVCGSYSFWGWVIFDISDIDMQKQERCASLLLLIPSSLQAWKRTRGMPEQEN